MARPKKMVYKKTVRVVKLEIYVESNINGQDFIKAQLKHTCGKDTAIALIKSYIDHNDQNTRGKA